MNHTRSVQSHDLRAPCRNGCEHDFEMLLPGGGPRPGLTAVAFGQARSVAVLFEQPRVFLAAVGCCDKRSTTANCAAAIRAIACSWPS